MAVDTRSLTRTEESLLSFWRNLFDEEEIGLDDDFFVLGGHSLLAARLAARVADSFGVEISLAQLFEMPTIAELAAYIDEERTAHDPRLAASALVRLKPGEGHPPLFCMHTFMGGVSDYLPLARLLAPDRPVYAVQGQGLVDNRLPARSVAGMAAHCVSELRKLQLYGPYHLLGSSFAGLVAFEAARQLRAAGEEVGLVLLLDSWLPYPPGKLGLKTYLQGFASLQRLRAAYHFNRQRRIALSHLSQIRPLPWREKARYVRVKGGALSSRLLDRSGRLPREVTELEVSHNRMLHASLVAMLNYRPRPYRGRIVYLYALDREGAPPVDQRRAWSRLALGGLELHSIPGNHHQMLGEPNVHTVARIVERCIDRATQRARSGRVGLPVA